MFPLMYLKVRTALKKMLPVDTIKYDKYKEFFDSVLREYQPSRYTAMNCGDGYSLEKYSSIETYFALDKIDAKVDYLNRNLYVMFDIKRPIKNMGTAKTNDIIKKTCAQVLKGKDGGDNDSVQKVAAVQKIAVGDVYENLEKLFSIGNKLQSIRNEEAIDILKLNTNVIIGFVFDWQSNKSFITIKGKETREKIEIKTPQIPLIGGCWSDSVAKSCITGQIIVSAMLKCVRVQVDYIARKNNFNVNVIVNDKCFYAPLMYYMKGDVGKEAPHKEYHPILKEEYPEAYQNVLKLRDGENYWNMYYNKE